MAIFRSGVMEIPSVAPICSWLIKAKILAV